MSAVVSMLLDSADAEKTELLLRCRPISTNPPVDMPEVRDAVAEFWAARIVAQNEQQTYERTLLSEDVVSEWSSIPKRNLEKLIPEDELPEDGVDIRLSRLDESQLSVLLDDTALQFVIEDDEQPPQESL